MAELVIEGLERAYGTFKAVDNISFSVEKGSFVTLLGPSGCGKSTTLWMLAGLDEPTAGRIAVGSETLVDTARGTFVPTEHRDFGLVFQSYALWPHMTVRRNLDFPLRLRSVPKAERQARIEEALSLVELSEQIDKYPFQLSGGQQQRVALARTLVYRPRLLLLDEPLSNLDAKLRERARIWLRELHKKLGVTTIYVTHDQSEALAMSDRILVMRAGRIVQDGPPEEIYRYPADTFVADFIGSSNFYTGRSVRTPAGPQVQLDEGPLIAVDSGGTTPLDAPVTVALRPERVRILSNDDAASPGDTVLQARVQDHSYLGARYQVGVLVGALVFRIESDRAPPQGTIRIAIPADAWMLFPFDSTQKPMLDHATA